MRSMRNHWARPLAPRDLILIVLGALSMQFFSTLLGGDKQSHTSSTVVFEDVRIQQAIPVPVKTPEPENTVVVNLDSAPKRPQPFGRPGGAFAPPPKSDLSSSPLPETTILHHAPGWTIFENVYMSNGTLFVLSTKKREEFPDIKFMTSTGLPGEANEESIRARMPTAHEMDFITPYGAVKQWHDERGNRVRTVEGNTLLFNDPQQFLDHYYHFCAELLLGTWISWSGTFHPGRAADQDHNGAKWANDPSDIPHRITRAIFAHTDAQGWRDKPGFNSYFLRAAFPSITVETQIDWQDRINATDTGKRVWHFPTLLLVDRSAAFRGEECGQRVYRTAAESFEVMRKQKLLTPGWWEPIRRSVLRFGGVSESVIALSEPLSLSASTSGVALAADATDAVAAAQHRVMAQDVVITYISRQSSRRHLIADDHDVLVSELEALVKRKNGGDDGNAEGKDERGRRWELNIVKAETLTKDEQLAVVAKTTILLGVHGNGLTHLIMMPATQLSTVIEIFYPGGFAHDYEWTTRALGMRHYAVWKDKYMTYPDTPRVDYPEGFQGEQIPVDGHVVAKLVEDRADVGTQVGK